MKEFSGKYLELLTGTYKDINLTRITSPEEFYEKQIQDSILPIELFPQFKSALGNGLHLDIGFGGGFPLLPLAKLFPKTNFYGFEARRKKADVVLQISKDLGLGNVSTHHLRIENLNIDKPASVSFKAVGKIEDFLMKVNAVKGTKVFFYKGPNLDELEKVPEKLANFRLILKE
ncbi:MAG: class I SAM-dependent methyltransferase [Halobacteriovoraceae bacterium]|nr:class I SAM-dependent methyltransferase [Halobacteriovoraceae bacterium]